MWPTALFGKDAQITVSNPTVKTSATNAATNEILRRLCSSGDSSSDRNTPTAIRELITNPPYAE
jgi:hypothetical protein